MIKCICFSRVSSSRQSYTAQTNAVKAAAIADGYKENEIAVVQGKESAIKLDADKRQTLKEMNDLIEENPSIESVYCFALDRLSRHVAVIINVAEELAKKEINLVFLNPHKLGTLKHNKKTNKIERDYYGWMLLAFLSVGAEMEMKIKTERATNKKEEMKANNEVIGKLILGYKNVNRKATIDPIKGAIVKWIFKSYNEGGMSLTKIFDKGVELGYWKNLPIRSSKCSKIRQILMNYSYCGEPNNSGFVYPKLIEKKEIEKAIENMKQAANKPKTISKVISLAKGKIRDAKTNYMLKYDGNHLKYVHKDDSANKVISAALNIVDFCVWKEASRIKWNLLSTKDNDTRINVGKELDEIDDRINNIEQIIDVEINERFNKTYKAYVNSRGRISDDDYNRDVAAIEREEKKYKKQIESLEQKKVELKAMLQDLAEKEDSIDPSTIMTITDHQHQKEIADEVIDYITVERTEVGQIIRIYNKYESKPQVFINKTKTNHTVIYWMINEDGDAIDISDEYKPRYSRTYKEKL